MLKKTLLLVAGAIMLGIFTPCRTQAAIIQGITINAATAGWTNAGHTDKRWATNLVNGVGMYGDTHVSVPGGAMWLSVSTAAGAYSNAFVTFDLGAVHPLESMKVLNYNEQQSGANILTRRGIQFGDILTAGEDMVFSTNFANFAFQRAPGLFTNFAQTVNMGGLSARYVRINVRTNFGSDNQVGLSKVFFIDTNVPPTLVSANRSLSADRVTVRFSESILATTATNLANYSLQSGVTPATVLSATMGQYNDTVILQTSPLNTNLVYTLSASNVRDLANTISITNNSQATVGSELVIWLKADSGVTADGSGFVTQWNDQSGNGNHAIQADPATQPILVPGVANGNPAVHFDGFSQLMEIPHNASLVADRDITIYAVVSVDSLTTTLSHGLISKTLTNVPSSFDLQIARLNGKPSFVRGSGGGFTSFAPNVGVSANQYYLVAVVMRGTNLSTYLNGNFNGSALMGAAAGDSGTNVRLGIRQDNALKFTGNLAEVMVLRGAISDTEKTTLDNYLGNKYGISVLPLAITEQPASVSRLEGQTATFWVNAVAGSPTILYQWQKNSVNIGNATNATYTTPALALADNGASYRVVVSTPFGVTTNSASATVTVTADNKAPTIYSATRATGSSNSIVVVFSEPVNVATATASANYTLNNGATVSSAVIGATANQVILTTSPLSSSIIYSLTIQNVKDLFNNTIAPSSTLILPSAAALWLRADSGVTTNGVGVVTEWNDQTLNRNHASQFLSAQYRPTLVDGAMNGRPAIHFTGGASNFLQVASSPSLVITNDVTFYFVVNVADLTTPCHIFGKTANNLAAPFDYYLNSTTTRFYHGNGTAGYGLLTSAAPTVGVPHVLSVSRIGTTTTLYLDGAVGASATIVTNIADTGSPLRIGSRSDLAQFMNGDISEVLFFGSGLSVDERRVVDTYLSARYFPFSFTLQPQSISKLEGQTATFTVGASQGSASFIYQWQKNSIDIPGATNSSYTTPLLVQGDSGSNFRVIVSTPGGTGNISDTAVLTVSPDTELPTVLSVGKAFWSQSKLVVVFSEAINPSTLTNLANYQLDNGAIITSATIGDAPNKVIFTTSNFNPANAYSLTVENIRDLYNNIIATTSQQIGYYPASLALWLKADAGMTTDGFNGVTSWGDQSGNGNNANQLSFDTAPLYVPSALDGLPAVNFNGTNQFLAVSPTPSLAIVGDITIYVVAKFKDFISTTNEIGLVEKSDGNLPAPYDLYLVRSSGLPRFYRGGGIGQPTSNGTGLKAPSTNSASMISVVVNGTQLNHYLNGITNGTSVLTAPAIDAGKVLGIGSRDDLRTKMNGDIKEILLIGSAVSDADRAAIDQYLASKYGIITGPLPTITIKPAGNSVTLSWATPNLTFILEAASSLNGPVWTTVPDTITSANGTSSVSISAGGAQKFYRLRKQ